MCVQWNITACHTEGTDSLIYFIGFLSDRRCSCLGNVLVVIRIYVHTSIETTVNGYLLQG